MQTEQNKNDNICSEHNHCDVHVDPPRYPTIGEIDEHDHHNSHRHDHNEHRYRIHGYSYDYNCSYKDDDKIKKENMLVSKL